MNVFPFCHLCPRANLYLIRKRVRDGKSLSRDSVVNHEEGIAGASKVGSV
jgi:hypothetical protein